MNKRQFLLKSLFGSIGLGFLFDVKGKPTSKPAIDNREVEIYRLVNRNITIRDNIVFLIYTHDNIGKQPFKLLKSGDIYFRSGQLFNCYVCDNQLKHQLMGWENLDSRLIEFSLSGNRIITMYKFNVSDI